MKRGKALLAAALALCLVFALAGCSKDSILDGFNSLLHHVSQYALTDEKDLQGEKVEGVDTYTGSYTAEYDNFSGTEYLFGGTGLERESENELTVTYELTVASGSAELYWRDKDNRYTLTETEGNGSNPVTLTAGDNYLVFEGEDFQGALHVTVE